MNKITVVCHKDHSHGYEDFEGKCLLCVVEKLRDENQQLTHQLFDYRAAFIRARDREWVGLTDEERRSLREWQEIQKELGPVWSPMMLYLYLAIEDKLKEKNA